MNTDLEIAEEEICPRLQNVRARGVILGDVPYDCPDVKNVPLMNVYGSDIGEVEVCD